MLPLGHLAAHVLPFPGTGRGTLQGEKATHHQQFLPGEGQILIPSVGRKKELDLPTLGLQGNETHSLWKHASRQPFSLGILLVPSTGSKPLSGLMSSSLMGTQQAFKLSPDQPFIIIISFAANRFPLVRAKLLNYAFSAYLYFKC